MLQSKWKLICLMMVGALLGGCQAERISVQTPAADSQGSPAGLDLGSASSFPVIDGSVAEGEWQAAQVWDLEDGGELYMIMTDEVLYLAVQAVPRGMIAGNVFLFNGGEIRVLHSSAALGTAVFQLKDGQWTKIKDFEWCCRSRKDDQFSRDARQLFFTQDGWLGANSFLGVENELEYMIHLDGSERALAVNYLWADEVEAKRVWPEGLSDGVSWPSEGGFPDVMEFSPGDWFVLSPAQ